MGQILSGEKAAIKITKVRAVILMHVDGARVNDLVNALIKAGGEMHLL